MEDTRQDSFKKEKEVEVIDGVTIVHSGMFVDTYGPQGEILPNEILKMYDANGNRFYSNFNSIEEANKAIARFAEEGITAVIGPKAPWSDPNTGNPIPNSSETAVGVFIVSVPEKSEDFSSHKAK